MTKPDEPGKRTGLEIAVIGMAARFPGTQKKWCGVYCLFLK
jgi:hypothetical protein